MDKQVRLLEYFQVILLQLIALVFHNQDNILLVGDKIELFEYGIKIMLKTWEFLKNVIKNLLWE
jgi:hypothetical protein